MSDKGKDVDGLLKSLASSRIKDEISDSYSEFGESMKHTGAASNNMLLSVIHGEMKRTADEVLRLNSKASKTETMLSTVSSQLREICELLTNQNSILASISLGGESSETAGQTRRQANVGGNWFYQGTRLSSRYHVYACILFHLIDMVQLHMDNLNIHYPDSVDCDFKTMHNAVRIVCTERCHIQRVEYKNTILVKEKDSQAFDVLYPLISSSSVKHPTTLSESMISQLLNPVTRPVMQDIEWIRQRLCFLEGILSVKQMDILRSVGFPVIKPGTEDELNWDSKQLRAKSSHPSTRNISDLIKTQKDEYIKARMLGKSVTASYEIANAFKGNKK